MGTESSSQTFFDYPTVIHEKPEELVFLQDRPESDWATLLEYTEMRPFKEGELIIRSGDTERALYLLTAGNLAVRTSGNKPQQFKTLYAPSVIGEVAFLDGAPRSVDLVALTSGEVLRFSLQAFELLSARHPDLGRAILLDLGRIVSGRLRMATELFSSGI